MSYQLQEGMGSGRKVAFPSLSEGAKRMREKRAAETYEEKEARKRANAERMRLSRANETEEQRAMRRMLNRIRMRSVRARETSSQPQPPQDLNQHQSIYNMNQVTNSYSQQA
jgi:hypothetical protein